MGDLHRSTACSGSLSLHRAAITQEGNRDVVTFQTCRLPVKLEAETGPRSNQITQPLTPRLSNNSDTQPAQHALGTACPSGLPTHKRPEAARGGTSSQILVRLSLDSRPAEPEAREPPSNSKDSATFDDRPGLSPPKAVQGGRSCRVVLFLLTSGGT
jgi:hypothetical protein